MTFNKAINLTYLSLTSHFWDPGKANTEDPDQTPHKAA